MKFLFTSLLFLSIFSGYSQQIPQIILKAIDGETINIRDLSQSDDIKVFSFWATWCVPCINELDAISDVYEEWQKETNVEIIAIATDDSRTQKRIRPLVNGKEWNYTILLDNNQELKRALNITTIPHTIIVQNGKIIYQHSGYTPGSEDELYEIIKTHSK